MRVLSCLRVSISPPPPGVGCANGRSVCGCGRDGGLLASVLCSCRSLACARSLLSRLRFGFSFPGSPRFSDLLGRVLFVCVGSRPASPRVPRPVRFLLRACFPPRLIRRVWLARRPLPARPCLGDSGAVPCHPIGEVPCFAPSASAFRLSSPMRLVFSLCFARLVPCFAVPRRSSPRLSVCLLRSSWLRGGLVAVLPRFAHLPALLVVGRGEAAAAAVCDAVPSRAARCLEFRSSWSLVPRLTCRLAPCPSPSSLLASSPRYRAGWRRLSTGRAPLCPCLLVPPRLVRWRREYLVPA